MAFENLIIRTQRNIGGIAVDGILTEDTAYSVRTTVNPVEFGENITDHVIITPTALRLEGVVSDTPIGLAAYTESISDSVGGAFDAVTSFYGKSEALGRTRSQQIFQSLVDMMNRREVVSIQTNLARFDNMIFTTLSARQDKDTSRAVFFVATFVEILVVEPADILALSPDNIEGDKQRGAYSSLENLSDVSAADLTQEQELIVFNQGNLQ